MTASGQASEPIRSLCCLKDNVEKDEKNVLTNRFEKCRRRKK